MRNIISILMFAVVLGVNAQNYSIHYYPATHNQNLITLTMFVGSYSIDNVIIDTGSTTTQLTYNDYVQLKSLGFLTKENFLGNVKTRNGNGYITNKPKYKLPSVSLDTMTLNNVEIIFDTVNKTNGMRLLGLNVLSRFSKITVDFQKEIIIFTK